MQHIFFLVLSALAAAVEAADVAPHATPALCSQLQSCYVRYAEASIASAYCTSFMKVVPTTKSVTVTYVFFGLALHQQLEANKCQNIDPQPRHLPRL